MSEMIYLEGLALYMHLQFYTFDRLLEVEEKEEATAAVATFF